jgi:hypothetical protein
VINLGLRTTQSTRLVVEMPAVDATAVLRIGRDARFAIAAFQETSARISLPAGDYIITLDSATRPGPDARFAVSTDVEAVYMTAGDPQSEVRPLIVGTGVQVNGVDPKDPWPSSLVRIGSSVESSFLASSSILPEMRALVDKFGGKGADDETARSPVIHALIVGIDNYADGTGQGGRDGVIYRPLRGCVRDALEVERFLRDSGVAAERITRLIAPRRNGPGSELPATPGSLPTYDNIVSAWQRVIATANPGDVVYVHYSGHGGRCATLFPAFKSNGLDESLAPCDINQPTGRHLRDVEIAMLLKQMAQRELLTTLVLDSCHSGSATRGDEAQARRGDHDDTVSRTGQSADNSAVASRADLEVMAKHLASSVRRAEESWRIDAGGAASSLTTIIAACRAHESSYEYAFDGTTRRGALTHFWLDTLRQRTAGTTYRTAYRQTFARVQSVFKEQAPMLLGASDRLVLGTSTLAQPSSIAILDVDGDRVTLAAGASGLLSVGTRLAVLPAEVPPELADLSSMRQIEVTSVAATSSRARVIGDPGHQQPPITLGSQAVIVTYAPTMRREVCWVPSKQPSSEELIARAELEREIAADTTNAIGLATTEAAHYQVTIERSRFVILDPAGSPLPHLRPEIQVTDANAARTVKNRLVHLARFHNVQELTNSDPCSPLAGKLELSLHASHGGMPAEQPLPVDLPLPCGSEFYLRIRNRSSRPLSLGIFDLAPDWGIEYVNHESTLSVESGAFIDVQLLASLPAGYETATDVLKVIGTLDHADLEWLTLRPLDQPYVPKRATRAPRTAFEELLAVMHEPSRATRNVAMAASPTSGWCEAQICLEVRR